MSTRTTKTLCLTGSLLLGLTAQSQGRLGLVYDVPARVTQNDALVADLRLDNTTAERLSVNMGVAYLEGLELAVTDPAGARQVTQPRFDGFQATGRFSLAPGERFTRWIVLNEWLDFSAAGAYRRTIRFHGTVTAGSGERARPPGPSPARQPLSPCRGDGSELKVS